MVLKVIWRKTHVYKRFELDIWGHRILSMMGKTRLGHMFNAGDSERDEYHRGRRARYVYRIDIDAPLRKHSRSRTFYITRHLSRLFYLTLSYAQFHKFAAVAARKEGSWSSNFIMLVENRLIGMLYRMQVNMNIFELRWFVLTGNVLVNNKKITYYNALVDYFKILRFKSLVAEFAGHDIVERFKAGLVYFAMPRYMFISYNHMLAFVFCEPKRADLAFPIKLIDVYRGAYYS